jgi:hypothetical protein
MVNTEFIEGFTTLLDYQYLKREKYCYRADLVAALGE